MTTTNEIMASFCLEGKITEQHATDIKEIITTLTAKHEEEKAAMVREMLSTRCVDIIYASDIKTIAAKYAVDLSKTDVTK